MATIINAIIFLTTAVLLAQDFRKDGKWVLRRGLKAFRFFTVLSNALCAMSALLMIVAPSPAALLLKYLGTASVTVTLMTVIFFLGPTQGGYGKLLSGGNLYLHLIGPLLAIISFCFFEKRELSFRAALLGMVPVLAYGAVYLYKVLFAPPRKRWEDFYGFNRGGKWPVALAGMALGSLIVCALLWAL